MIGFGMMDNTILIHVGDAIERNFGARFKLTGLQAASGGQVVSDFCGVLFGGIIESVSRRYVAAPGLTVSQFQLRMTQVVGTAGAALGVVIGCLLGMCNLFLIDLEEAERLRRLEELKTICDAVMESAVESMQCPLGTIFLVDHERQEIWSRAAVGYDGVVSRPLRDDDSLASWVAIHKKPLNVADAHKDPRFNSDICRLSGITATCVLTYPVFAHDDDSKVVAVVQFYNKPGGFQEEDVRVMRMLCVHCSIFISRTSG